MPGLPAAVLWPLYSGGASSRYRSTGWLLYKGCLGLPSLFRPLAHSGMSRLTPSAPPTRGVRLVMTGVVVVGVSGDDLGRGA